MQHLLRSDWGLSAELKRMVMPFSAVWFCLICIRAAYCENYPWLLKLASSPIQSGIFKGSLFLSFTKTVDGSSEEQMFDTILGPDEQIQRTLSLSRKDLNGTVVKIFFANYSCQPQKPNPVMIRSIILISGLAGQMYTADTIIAKTEHAIGQCVNPEMFREFTVIEKIFTTTSDICFADGKFQDEGSVISVGCRENCTCIKGALKCIPTCQPVDTPENSLCRETNAMNQCCPKVECQHTDKNVVQIIKCQNPKLEDELDMVVPPWVYFIVTDRYSEKKGSWCGASLISEKYLLTPAHCIFTVQSSSKLNILSPPEFIEVYKPSSSGKVHLIGEVPSERITSIRVHPNYRHSGTYRPFSQYDMALLELAVPVKVTSSDQYVNLPWSNECYQYFDNIRCQVVTSTYANDTSTLVFDNVFGSGTIAHSDECQKERNFFCYEKTARPNQLILGGIDGSGIVAKRNGHYELIGVAVSDDRTWHKPGTPGSSEINVLTICESLIWINQTIFSH